MSELGVSRTEVANALGLRPNQVWQILAAARDLQISEAMALADVLKVHPLIVIEKLGLHVPVVSTPVVGVVDAAGFIDRTGAGEVAPSPDATGFPLAAVRFGVDLTAVGILAGAHAYFVDAARVNENAAGRLSVVETGDADSRPIVGVVVPAGLSRAKITALGSGKVIETTRLVSAAPILWVRMN